jgi:hypothetical protein
MKRGLTLLMLAGLMVAATGCDELEDISINISVPRGAYGYTSGPSYYEEVIVEEEVYEYEEYAYDNWYSSFIPW